MIEIRNEVVFIDGQELKTPEASFEPIDGVQPPELAEFGPLTIPSDCFFVLGDNRRNSFDSRFHGPVPLADLHGTAKFIYWSQRRDRLPQVDFSSPEPAGGIR